MSFDEGIFIGATFLGLLNGLFLVEDHDRRSITILWRRTIVQRYLEYGDACSSGTNICSVAIFFIIAFWRFELLRGATSDENCETILCLILSKIAEPYFHYPLQAFICSSLIGAIIGQLQPRAL